MKLQTKVRVFSGIFFFVLTIVSISVYFIVDNTMKVSSISQSLEDLSKTEKMIIQSSVESELGLAIKMADSDIIRRYFLNPADKELEQIAFAEFESYRRAFLSKSNFWLNTTDLRFFSDGEFSYIVDITDPENSWYDKTIFQTDIYNFNINYNPVLDVTKLWINAPVKNAGVSIGMVGTGIPLDDIIKRMYAEAADKCEAVLFDQQGKITVAKDTHLMEQQAPVTKLVPFLEKDLQTLMNKTSNGQPIISENGSYLSAMTYIPAMDCYFLAWVNVEEDKSVTSVMLFAVIAAIASFALIFIGFNIFIKLIISPLSRLEKAMIKISGGDFTADFKYSHSDEIGQLSKGLDFITKAFSSIISDVRTHSSKAQLANKQEQQHLTDGVTLTQHIVGDVQNISEIVEEQKNLLHEASKVVLRNNESIDSFKKIIDEQSVCVTKSETGINSLFNSVKKLETLKDQSNNNMSTLSETSKNGERELLEVIQQVNGISSYSEQLLDTNRLIASITEQTNLLAMNASIEAAHAGEAGKGFAVVAEEIRKLAEQTRQQSEQVDAVIKDIIKAVENVSMASSSTNKVFSEMVQNISDVTVSFAEMSNEIEQQDSLSSAISTLLDELAKTTDKVAEGFTLMHSDSVLVNDKVTDTVHRADSLAKAMEQINSSSKKIESLINIISVLANRNNQDLTEISTGLDKYVVR